MPIVPEAFGEEWEQLSLYERAAVLPDGPERDMLMETILEMDPNDPYLRLRPAQLHVIEDDHWIVVVMAGRGAGKSKTGAHWTIERAKNSPGCRIALIGRTVSDVRDVMVLGDSGIMASSPKDFVPIYTPSLRKLEWPNGSTAYTYSAEIPGQLRGPQQHYAWCDELAAYKMTPDDSGANIWDNCIISTRLGKHPQILVTTTPKRVDVVRQLYKDADRPDRSVSLHKASTMANRANLSREYIQAIYERFAGTHLERQELHGELVGDSPGALWKSADIKIADVPDDVDLLDTRIIIGVDPAVEAGRDETGIIVVRATQERDLNERRAWVLEDLSINGAPDEWAEVVAEAQSRYSRPNQEAIVVVEGNQGGQLLNLVLRQSNPNMPIAIVKAVRSKSARAEPVVVSYRRGKVRHTDDFVDLVEEMVGWEPDVSRWSPGRLDALVWALTVLLIDPGPLRAFSPILALGPSGSGLMGAIPPHRQGRVSDYGFAGAPWRR